MSDAILSAGVAAPDFELPVAQDRALRLSAFRGRPVVLAFYPADWSPVCGDQLAVYAELIDEFRRYDAELLGISVDSVWSHAAFTESRNIPFPLLADFEPKGVVARTYGVWRASTGTSERALFVIDRAGTIRWSYGAALLENPGADGILAALDALGASGA